MNNSFKLPAVAILVIAFAACHKESSYLSPFGTWHEVKVRVRQDSSGKILNDTTYAGNTFTSDDYIQFNTDASCIISSSHEYPFAVKGSIKIPSYFLSRDTLRAYGLAPNAYYLSSFNNVINPGGFSTADTATIITTHSLQLHIVNSGPFGPYELRDNYYSR